MDLPKDVKLEICQHLPGQCLAALSRTCKQWNDSCEDENLWRRLVKRVFSMDTKHMETWLQTYKDLMKPVIILITASTCAYSNAKSFLDDKTQLESCFAINKIHFEMVGDTIFGDMYPKPYKEKSEQLKKFIKWVPTIMIFTKKSWIEDGELVGEVFSGGQEHGKFIYYNGTKLNFENVSSWIRKFDIFRTI